MKHRCKRCQLSAVVQVNGLHLCQRHYDEFLKATGEMLRRCIGHRRNSPVDAPLANGQGKGPTEPRRTQEGALAAPPNGTGDASKEQSGRF